VLHFSTFLWLFFFLLMRWAWLTEIIWGRYIPLCCQNFAVYRKSSKTQQQVVFVISYQLYNCTWYAEHHYVSHKVFSVYENTVPKLSLRKMFCFLNFIIVSTYDICCWCFQDSCYMKSQRLNVEKSVRFRLGTHMTRTNTEIR
jgi:hypothetical protein